MAEKKPPAKKAPAKKAPAKAPAKKAPAKAVVSRRPAASSTTERSGSSTTGNAFQRWWGKRQNKRAAKKRRLAKLPTSKRILRRVGVLTAWVAGGFIVLLAATLFLYYRLGTVPRPEALPLPQVATVEYNDGSVMARVGTVDRTVVPLSQVPESVRWAVLAAEDRNFYSEHGFSVRGTARAAVSDVFGGNSQGGSGITQQYVKNAYLTNEKTLSRKLRELMISVKLDREYPKDEILEYYLNTVYFGRGVYGVQAAADAFFGEDVSELTTAQGAVLAAMLRDPGYYDPSNNLQAAQGRWNFVLDGMVSMKKLSAADRAAQAFPTVKPPRDRLGVSGPKALIVQRVINELDAHGISETEINTRGIVIHTSIDRHAQNDAEAAIATTFGSLTEQQRAMKNALVAVNPATGAVLAYYGGPSGPGYDGNEDYFDYAGMGSRPPGSSFKPYTLATVLTETLAKTGGKPQLSITSYVPGDYCVTIEGRKICNDPGDQKYSAKAVRIADAMKWSLNTSFDKLAQQAGPDAVADLAHSVGVAKKDSNGKATLVDADGETGFGIGIGDYPVSPLDQAVGYSTFASGGTLNQPFFVKSVNTSAGRVLYTHKAQAKRVLDPAVANDVTLSLEPIADWSHVALNAGRVSAAKTGTVGIAGTTANSDAWMVGYTPQIAAAVWTGSGDSTTPIYDQWGSPEYGSDLPGKTWKLFMDSYLGTRAALPMATRQLIVGGTNLVNPPKPSTSVVSRQPSASSTTEAGQPSASSTTEAGQPSAPSSASASVTGSASVPTGGASQSP